METPDGSQNTRQALAKAYGSWRRSYPNHDESTTVVQPKQWKGLQKRQRYIMASFTVANTPCYEPAMCPDTIDH
eukprot:scaffold263752_cov24-Prasinocladus_malaysianus.AAC.1